MPVGARFYAPVQTGYGAYPASYIMVTIYFLGRKAAGRGVDGPLPPSVEVKEKVELCIFSPLSAFVACSRVKFHRIEVYFISPSDREIYLYIVEWMALFCIMSNQETNFV
jgi:hypothetical protein